MSKEIKQIAGADVGSIQIGKPATLFADGKMVRTSNVVDYQVAGGRVYVETRNSIYTTHPPRHTAKKEMISKNVNSRHLAR